MNGQFQWYPGHMTKAVRAMKRDMSSVDMVIELADARVPYSSRNPEIAALCGDKKRLLVLNKADLADEKETRHWVSYLRANGETVLSFCAKNNTGGGRVVEQMKLLMKERMEKDRARGVAPMVRAMVVGIPNAGKSALINCLAKRALTKTANRPGVTRGKQWISLADEIRLLDTPGILWPKFEDQTTGLHLAMIGSLNDVNLDLSSVAVSLVSLLEAHYPGMLYEAYGFTEEEAEALTEEERLTGTASGVIGMIGKTRGCILRGAKIDYEKASTVLLTDFRNGKLGRRTLEKASEIKE